MKYIYSFVLLALVLVSVPSSALAADTDGPIVSEVSPLSATYTVPEFFTATASDPSGVASCELLVSSIYTEPMTYNNDLDRWEATYTFVTERSANSIRAVCLDSLGNETKGKSKIIEVSEAPSETTQEVSEVDVDVPAEVDATEWSSSTVILASPVLVKTVCPGGEDVNHRCRAVYFLDNNGYRHAFPNEKVYFTWYTDWTNIHLVSDSVMSSFPLGLNVTYHPGKKMVKFVTAHTVYAVAQYGTLRPIASEDVAVGLYGENWNQQIDDISDVFYGNYEMGEAVITVSDFDKDGELNSVTSINDNFLFE